MFSKMNTRKKRFVKRINASSLAAILILSTVLSLNAFMGNDNKVYAAESSAMGTNSYTTGITGGATLTVGSTYTLGGNAKTGGSATPQAQVLAISGTKALMQSKGLWGGTWPGSGELSSTAATYFGDLKNAISNVYLPQGYSENAETVYWNGSQTNAYASTVHSILTSAASGYSTFGASGNIAWLGTPYGSDYAYYVHSNGYVDGTYTSICFVCAPAFTIDTSKVSLSGSTLTYATFTDSTSITATQSITSVEEGASVDLSQVITGVVYNGGDNNGRSASYTVAISTNDGSISGTTWTVPTGINSNKTVTLTITEQNSGNYLSTTKTVTITPRAAGNIKVAKSGSFPSGVKTGSQTNLASYITVTGYDSANQYDGEISSYTMSADIGSFSGTTYIAGTVSRPSTATITVRPNGNIGGVSYASTSTTFTITVNPNITGITATQAISSVEEGQVIDVNSIITGVQYVGGEADSGYRISITGSGCGTLSGTTWTAPTGLTSNKDVTLTITDSENKYTTTKTVTVTPRAAKFISVEKLQSFPEAVVAKTTVDLASHILVTGYDNASQSDGTITSYTLSADFGSFDGTRYTAGNATTAKTANITVTATCSLGSVNYTSKTATFQIQIKPDTTGWTDREELTPEEQKRFHTYLDDTTGITWHYKYNDNGDILYLYTEDNVAKIISDGKVLLVPSSINGVSVVGIGGGHKDGDIIPFIPSSGDNVNDTWTSIHIPSSVRTINDGAFLGNGAGAEIVIPGNVSKVGVQAFKDSRLKSVIFNNADALSIYSEAFADIPTLKSVVIRGNGTTIKTRAFARDTGLTEIEIPYGTKFKGNTDSDDSYAFLDTTGLATIKIDTEIVEGNIFSGNKNLAKVIFGENVKRVRYDWAGTAASNASTLEGTVARETYVLNEETVFEMDKSFSGSPFGYANSLIVKGKTKDLNGDSEAYNPSGDLVTAKVAYLAQYYNSDPDVKSYAKGSASSISISVTADPSNDTGVTETVSDKQTDIEAYYKGIIFTGKTLDKDNMTVYKMFKTLQKGTYASDEFYVLRTTDADTLLEKENTTEKNGEGDYIATYSDDIIASFKEKDLITAADSDLTAGTVDVKVVVLRKDADGKVFIDHSAGDKVIAFTYQVAVPVKAYTAEDDFFENYGSYTEVIQTINDLKSQIEGWKQQIANLTGLNGAALDDLELVSAELEKKQQELNTYIQLYNNLVETLNELIKDTDVNENGYIATVPDGDGGTKEIVYINNKELDATPTGEKHNGKDLYTSTGDIGDGTHTYTYYVDENGVHIISIDGVTQNPEIVYTDTIRAMQRKLTAQVTALQKELNDYRGIIPDFKKLLNITEENFDTLSGKEQLQIIYTYVQSVVTENGDMKTEKAEIDAALENLCAALQAATGNYEKNRDGADGQESAADKINSITLMVQQLSSNFNANNKYLRENICEINRAYGYGHYVKYNDKYVFAIYENDSFVYYIKTSSTERQYLLTPDGGATFEPAQDPEAVSLAAANDGTEGSKFMLLDDNTNGFNPYVSNPLGTYKTAMSSFINGLNGYNEKTDDLITALNAINKKSPGDDGYIEIPDNTSADSINEAIGQALESVKIKLNALELQRATYSTNMAGIAKILDEYLAGDYSGATELSDEESAAVLLAVKNAYADLELLRGNMADVNSALSDLYDSLFKAFGDMGLETNQDTGKARGEETTADKIESITGMVNQITASYNSLKEQYDTLKDSFQKVIDSVYGEDEKTVDQVTAQQIINQIEKNEQDAIAEAVNEALQNADDFDTISSSVQQSIAVVIDDILDGKTVDTSTLDPALQTQLTDVQSMKAEIDALKDGSDAYAEFLKTLRTALSLDDSADAAKILESIQGMKDQVQKINTDLAEANSTISKIQSKLGTDKKGDELVALVGTGSGSNTSSEELTTAYNNGYNAGFIAGSKNSTSSSDSSSSEAVKALSSQISTLSSANSSLTAQITSLSSANSALSTQLSTAKANLTSVEKENDSLSTENKTLKSSNAALETENDSLAASLATVKKSLASSQNKVDSLTKSNTTLKDSNKKYKTQNATLTEKNSSLSSENSSLKTQVSSLTTQLSAAKSSSSSTRSTATTTAPTSNTTAVTATTATTAAPAPQTTVSTAPVSESVDTSNIQSSATEDNENDEDSEDDEESDDDIMISGGASALALEKVSNAVGATITTSLPGDVNADEGLITVLGDSLPLDMITTNGASISETTAEEKEHANQFFRYYAANISELLALGVKGISVDSDTLAIEGMASIDIIPSETQREAMANGEKVTVEISYSQLVNGEDYLIVHESRECLGSYDIQVVTAIDGELVFDLDDLSPVSFAHVNKNAATISVSSTLTGDEAAAGETGKSNRTMKMVVFLLVMILAMGAFVFFCIKKGGREKGRSSFSGGNTFRKGSRA